MEFTKAENKLINQANKAKPYNIGLCFVGSFIAAIGMSARIYGTFTDIPFDSSAARIDFAIALLLLVFLWLCLLI